MGEGPGVRAVPDLILKVHQPGATSNTRTIRANLAALGGQPSTNDGRE